MNPMPGASRPSDEQRRTVIVDRYLNLGSTGVAGGNSYSGLRIYALPGLHDALGAAARSHLAPGGRLLDLAAGSGALSKRMLDLGFQVHATDYVGTGFKLHGQIPFKEADLNLDFANDYAGECFDAVVASEIIEHLENPRHFLRQLVALLRPGGRLLLSTPNPTSTASRLRFLTDGRFQWFGNEQYRGDGHITPVTPWQLRVMLAEVGLLEVVTTSFGDSKAQLAGSPRLRWLAAVAESLLFRGDPLKGDILVCVAEKPSR